MDSRHHFPDRLAGRYRGSETDLLMRYLVWNKTRYRCESAISKRQHAPRGAVAPAALEMAWRHSASKPQLQRLSQRPRGVPTMSTSAGSKGRSSKLKTATHDRLSTRSARSEAGIRARLFRSAMNSRPLPCVIFPRTSQPSKRLLNGLIRRSRLNPISSCA